MNLIEKANKFFKAFTLVELMVTLGIIVIMTAISVPILVSQRNRAKSVESAASLIKDAILSTQNMAFAPQDPGDEYYVFVLDGLNKNYDVFKINNNNRTDLKKDIPLYKNIQLTLNPNLPNANEMQIAFRTSDGRPGFYYNGNFVYSDSSGWGSAFGGRETADIQVKFNSDIKTIYVQNITGQIDIK